MLAARGVSLGLGKINLSDLNQLPSEKHRSALIKREEKKKPPRIIIKKKADAKTVWAACRAVIFGCIVIAVGLAMTVLGYFDKHFSERISIVNGVESVYHDKVVQIQLKSMQYLGPVLMGIGSFILIVACVVTLESRDKHAQIITEESLSVKRRRMMSLAEDNVEEGKRKQSQRLSFCTTAEIHRPRHGQAPLADEDSLDLHSCSSEVLLADAIRVDSDETYRHSYHGALNPSLLVLNAAEESEEEQTWETADIPSTTLKNHRKQAGDITYISRCGRLHDKLASRRLYVYVFDCVRQGMIRMHLGECGVKANDEAESEDMKLYDATNSREGRRAEGIPGRNLCK